MKIAIFGAVGNFGSKLVQGLEGKADLTLCSRSISRQPWMPHGARLERVDALALASSGALAGWLAERGIGVCLNAIGPYQGQGYGIALGAARAGCSYIDLSDGAAHVAGFAQACSAAFEASESFGICGASTLPGLSGAALRVLLPMVEHPSKLEICIAPAQDAPRGEATLRAVLGYCGKPVRWMSGSKWVSGTGWLDARDFEFKSLGRREALLCDVPDLSIWGPKLGLEEVWFGAAMELGLVGAGFKSIAWFSKTSGFDASRLAKPLLAAGAFLDRFGSGGGAMQMRLSGKGAGGHRRAVWELAAPGSDGPRIPCMPALALCEAALSGKAPRPGARDASEELSIGQFDDHFKRWGMRWRTWMD